MAKSGKSNGVSPKLIGSGILAIIALVFVLQNRERAQVRLLWMNVETGVWILLLITFVLGLGSGWLSRGSKK